MLNKELFTSNSEEWSTPQKLFDELDKEFCFTLDPCASSVNAKCERYFTKEQDGLLQHWVGTVFCNPPYGKQISRWVEKACQECESGATVVLLLPARTDTKYFHEYIYGKHEIRFLKGRLHFNDSKNAAPFPSMIVVMRPNAEELYNGGYRKQSEGEWETILHNPRGEMLNVYSHICKVEGCGYFYKDVRPYGYNYCPNCGAKMKGGEGK